MRPCVVKLLRASAWVGVWAGLGLACVPPPPDPALSPAARERGPVGIVADRKALGVFVFDSGTGAVLGKVPIRPPQRGFWAFGDALVLADGSLGFVSFEREIFVLELQASPPRIAARIPISSGGFELSFSPDQSAVLASGPPNDPFVSVIDIARREETHVFDVGREGGSHDVCADGTVPYSAGYGSHLGRLTLASDRTLSRAGDSYKDGTRNVYCAPRGPTGVFITTPGFAQAFRLLGFQLLGRGAPDVSRSTGICGVFHPRGDRFYLRVNDDTAGRAPVERGDPMHIGASGVVQLFRYDPATGAFPGSPLARVPVDRAHPYVGVEQMAIRADGSRLYVSQMDGHRVDVFDAENLSLLFAIRDRAMLEPTAVALPAPPPQE